MSKRATLAENPAIEDILDTYAHLPGIVNLAIGSVHWGPPPERLAEALASGANLHRYGNIEGHGDLVREIRTFSERKGLSLDGYEICVTAGGNQAFFSIALALCDSGDSAVILSPYYMSHYISLQLVDTTPYPCPFNPATFMPDWDELERLIDTAKPKMLVLTNPNNPSGIVWDRDSLQKLVCVCKEKQIWLIADQTYHEFVFGTSHTYLNSNEFGYDKIIHLFSFSKAFGMAGWRVGYAIYPSQLRDSIRKIQDTIPTHAAILSQQLATSMLSADKLTSTPFLRAHLDQLSSYRNQIWSVVSKFGTVEPNGAFYFLVPVPPLIDEFDAIDILATAYGVLLMAGTPFGAPNYLRLSYGSLQPSQIEKLVHRLSRGLTYLRELSILRQGKYETK